jgi:hypothetical protein
MSEMGKTKVVWYRLIVVMLLMLCGFKRWLVRMSKKEKEQFCKRFVCLVQVHHSSLRGALGDGIVVGCSSVRSLRANVQSAR